MPKKKKRDETDLHIGFGGVFKGVGQLLRLVSDLMEEGKTEVTKTGELKGLGTKGARAFYGVSIRTLAGGVPVVESFGNLRDTARGPVVEEVREPLVDVFEEGDEIRVIAEVPGVEEADIRVEVEGDIFRLTAERGERKYGKEVLLPAAVDASSLSLSNKNGILEIKIRKKAP